MYTNGCTGQATLLIPLMTYHAYRIILSNGNGILRIQIVMTKFQMVDINYEFYIFFFLYL